MESEMLTGYENIFDVLLQNGWNRMGGAYPSFTKNNCFLDFHPNLKSPDYVSARMPSADLVWVKQGRVERREHLEIKGCNGDILSTVQGEFNTKSQAWQANF